VRLRICLPTETPRPSGSILTSSARATEESGNSSRAPCLLSRNGTRFTPQTIALAATHCSGIYMSAPENSATATSEDRWNQIGDVTQVWADSDFHHVLRRCLRRVQARHRKPRPRLRDRQGPRRCLSQVRIHLSTQPRFRHRLQLRPRVEVPP